MPELPPLKQQIQNLKRIYPSLSDNEARGILKLGDPLPKLAQVNRKSLPSLYTAYGVPCRECGAIRWLKKADAKKALKGSNLCRGCSNRRKLKKVNQKKKRKAKK